MLYDTISDNISLLQFYKEFYKLYDKISLKIDEPWCFSSLNS